MRYVIIGHGAAGNAAARAIRARDPASQVLILSDEPHPGYYRPLIPALIEDGVGKDSVFRDEVTTPEGVEVRLKARVVAIDRQGQKLSLDKGESFPYDRLLIATGSSAIRPPITGLDGLSVHVLRTIDDAKAIKIASDGAKRAMVIGGGRVGMKASFALRRRGLQVDVVEKLTRVVPVQFDEVASQILSRAIESQGIRLILGQTVREVERYKGRLKGVVLDDGRLVEADLIVVAVGVQAKVELARAAGLTVNRGVFVDKHLRTSDPYIYAAGDVVETVDIVTGESIVSGIWTNAVDMGRVAGENMAGGDVEFPGAFGVLNSMDLADIPTVSVGLIESPSGDGYRVYIARRGDVYRKLVVKDGRLVGVLLIGDIEGAGVYTGLIKRQANVESCIEMLMVRRPSYAPLLRQEVPELNVSRT